MRLRDIWKEYRSNILIFGFAIIIVTTTLVAAINIRNSNKEAEIMLAEANSKMVTEDSVVVENAKDLGIRKIEQDRTYGNIKTSQFELYDKETSQVCKTIDGNINVEDILSTLTEYLKENNYKTIGVGMVDNKFYIQQDTSIEEEKEQKVNIVSLNESFSANDWFGLTEATYNNTTTKADSLCRYQTASGDNRQYIYVYTEKETEEVKGTPNKIQNDNENNINNITDNSIKDNKPTE